MYFIRLFTRGLCTRSQENRIMMTVVKLNIYQKNVVRIAFIGLKVNYIYALILLAILHI